MPERLKHKKSYVVINKIRTVDFLRFEPILDGKIIEVEIENKEYIKLISYITDEIEESLNFEEKKEIYIYKFKTLDIINTQIYEEENKHYKAKKFKN